MASYIPDRGHIITLDYDPALGEEVGKRRPSLVLSSRVYNENSGLLLCSPISTRQLGRKIEVPITHKNLDKQCVVVSSIVDTMDWKARNATFIGKATSEVLMRTQINLMVAIGGKDLIKALTGGGDKSL